MLRNKKKMKWPAYTTWWDRNEVRINLVLWGILFVLLLVARQKIVHGTPTVTWAIGWFILFIIDLFCLSFFTSSAHRK